MDHLAKFEKRLLKRKIIEGVAALISVILNVVLFAVRESSKVVETHTYEELPYMSFTTVSYPHENLWICLVTVSVMLLVALLSLFFVDLARGRLYHLDIDGEDVIIYTGYASYRLYVNGEQKDSALFKSYLEATLKNGLRITASHQFLNSFHVTFSDGRPPMNL